METEKFEEQLIRMSKPGVTHLKHQDMLAEAIVKAKDKSVLSGWWLSIPLYIIAALLMKSFFMRSTTLVTNMHEFKGHDVYASSLKSQTDQKRTLKLLIITYLRVSFSPPKG
jgi:H+/gluconate symporter-like permease